MDLALIIALVLGGIAVLLGVFFTANLLANRVASAARIKGYRSPHLRIGLKTLLCIAPVLALDPLVSLANVWRWPSGSLQAVVVVVGLIVLIGSMLLLARVVVAALPRRPLRVAGVRRSVFPYRLVAIVFGAYVVVVPLIVLSSGAEINGFAKAAPGMAAIATASYAMARRARAPQVEDPSSFADIKSSVLLLRGFLEEEVIFWQTRGFALRPELSAEDYLGKAIRKRIGPLIGFGNPEDYLPAGTEMVRYYAPDRYWQDEIVRLIEKVRAVLVLAGKQTAALSWELDHLREVHAQLRTFLIVVAIDWPTLRAQLESHGYLLPSSDPGFGSLIRFDDTGHGHVLISGQNSADDYATAIAQALI